MWRDIGCFFNRVQKFLPRHLTVVILLNTSMLRKLVKFVCKGISLYLDGMRCKKSHVLVGIGLPR